MQKISLSGNQLKIIAAIAMTLDHIGVQLFPDVLWLRLIGRLALPLFAFMIGEGGRYTKNRSKYLCSIAGLAILCQAGYFVAEGSLYQCILVTFALSVAVVYAVDGFMKNKSFLKGVLLLILITAIVFISEILPQILVGTDFAIDYGIWGIMLPVLAYLGKDKVSSIALMSFGLIMLSLDMGSIQWLSLFGIPILMLYGGERGKYRMKYFFYIYYPVHLAAIYVISLFINI